MASLPFRHYDGISIRSGLPVEITAGGTNPRPWIHQADALLAVIAHHTSKLAWELPPELSTHMAEMLVCLRHALARFSDIEITGSLFSITETTMSPWRIAGFLRSRPITAVRADHRATACQSINIIALIHDSQTLDGIQRNSPDRPHVVDAIAPLLFAIGGPACEYSIDVRYVGSDLGDSWKDRNDVQYAGHIVSERLEEAIELEDERLRSINACGWRRSTGTVTSGE